MNRYFRAAYSALCGNVNVLKSVCLTWEDLLWAYTKCLVDTNVELQIRETLGKVIFTFLRMRDSVFVVGFQSDHSTNSQHFIGITNVQSNLFFSVSGNLQLHKIYMKCVGLSCNSSSVVIDFLH